MKRTALLLLVLLLLLAACSPALHDEPEDSILLYYCAAETQFGSEEGALSSEPLEKTEESIGLAELLDRYLQGPVSPELVAVVPEDWTLLSAQLEEGTATLLFQGSALTEIERSLVNACLAKTVLQLEAVQRVAIGLEGEETPVTLSAKDILLLDTGMEPQEEEIVLYVADENRRYLVRETQTVAAMDAAKKPEYVVRQLLEAPESETCIPGGTALLGISVENGVCTVNLSSVFLKDMEQSFAAERIAVFSIVNSLTELPQIQTVDLWISGAPLERLYVLDLSNGLVRNSEMIAAAAGDASLDIDLYPACSDLELLAAVPRRVERLPETQDAQLLLDALLSYEGEYGLENCVPQGTKILSLKVNNGACVVDLTGEFLDGCSNALQERLAVRSIVATLGQLPEINTVEILVEGLEPVYRIASLSAVRMSRSDWFVQ